MICYLICRKRRKSSGRHSGDGTIGQHEYLLAARPLLWAPEIDGEVLVNDSEIEDIVYDRTYAVEVTERAGTQLVGRIVGDA